MGLKPKLIPLVSEGVTTGYKVMCNNKMVFAFTPKRTVKNENK